MSISKDDKDLFRQTIGSVRKLKKQDDRIQHPRPKLRLKIRKALREDPNFQDLMSDDTSWINTDPMSEMRFARNGVSTRLLRALIQGKFQADDVIDLHGLTASEARDELQHFLYHALKQNFFCVKIIHGQGNSSKGDPVIRGLIERWLKLQIDVLAFANPPQKMGGRGVTLCILRAQNPLGDF
ncbi:Smr/MutS family protein [Ignatzschineria sp. LJL83]